LAGFAVILSEAKDLVRAGEASARTTSPPAQYLRKLDPSLRSG